MAPKFGLDDVSCSNFDATLVLSTMLASQLNVINSSPLPPVATTGIPAQQGTKGNTSEHPSTRTKIWSELSGEMSSCGIMLKTFSICVFHETIHMQEVPQKMVMLLIGMSMRKEIKIQITRGRLRGLVR